MRRVLRGLLVILGILAAMAGYVHFGAQARLDRRWDIKPASFPIPRPLDDAEVWELTKSATAAAERDLPAIAAERSAARGKKLIASRLGCFDCHGDDYGGKVVMDVPPVMGMICPNITPAGVVKDYTDEDWVRILRHGIGKDGRASLMPATDYTWLSDEEIGDVVSYLRTLPPVERATPRAYLGPVMRAQMILGNFMLSAETIDHKAPRLARAPMADEASPELGRHLAQVCTGCHGPQLSGGPIVGGDPSWPPASNLTPHDAGLAKWSLDDFRRAMREGKRPGGGAISPVMPWRFYAAMSDPELDSLYIHLKALPPLETGASAP
jgi:mono/diheme cytochrome c family protein